MSSISSVFLGKYQNYAEDADFSELCGSASPHPVRCHGDKSDAIALQIQKSVITSSLNIARRFKLLK